MKIFRKTVSFILCFVLIAALLPTPEFSAADTLIDGVYYKYDKYDGTAAVTGCDDSATEITINPKFNGHAVTKIAYSAFKDKSALKKITIPDSITSIASYAFYGCTGLTGINIPDSVTSIAGYAFYGCTGLTGITIPENVTSIGDSSFRFCSGLTEIKIPDKVTSIAAFAFANCTGLTEITIPDGVTGIGTGIFSGCKGLTEITVPDSVTSIGGFAFANCTGITSITIPDGIRVIRDHTFQGCTGLTDINIPDSVTSIGGQAFYGCTGLTEMTLPDNLTSIEIHAFYGCSGLTDITIPDKVTSIGDYAFSDCIGLTEVTIPNSITNIGNYAFSNCNGLTKIIISDTEESTEDYNPYNHYIGDKAFVNCTGLTDITIPDGIALLGVCAFEGCTGLKSITVPDSVTSISGGAFSGCINLERINITDLIKWYGIDFNGASNPQFHSGASLYIGETEIDDYGIPDGMEKIGSYFFAGSNITDITIPDSVTDIGNYAFSDCIGLTGITIPGSVTNTGIRTFIGCKGLTNVIISDGVTNIGYFSFSECTGLTSVTIPDSVTNIENGAFSDCTALEEITIPASVTNIESFSFRYCKNLTILTAEGSYADIYAKNNNIPVRYLSEAPDSPILKGYEYDKENGRLVITVDKGSDERFEYSTDLLFWQKDPVLELKTSRVGKYKVYQRVAATSEYNESFPSKAAIIEDAPAPSASSVTETSVILKPTDGFEYRMDDGDWQDSNVFENLPLDSTHIFYQRKKATETSLAGLESPPAAISTAKHEHIAVGGWQTDENEHYKICFCGYEFDRGNHKGGEATCVANAVCKVCGVSYGEINANNHKNTQIVGKKDATCREDGYTGDVYCLDCGALVSYGKTVKSAGHDYRTEVIPATKEARGYTLHTCEVCGDSYKDEYTDITDVYYKTVGDHAVVTDCNGTMSDIVIKSEYEGLPVTEIEDLAFENKTNLKSITVPDSIVKIGKSAFKGCENLERVYIFDLAKWCGISFVDKDSNPLLYAGDLYLNGEKITDLIIPDGVEKIGDFAFVGATVSTVTIPSGVKHIGNGAFMHCIYIIIIRLPDSIITIGKEAFAYCPVLTDVRLPEHLDKTEDGLFAGCTGLTDIKIPDGVTIIGDGAFSDCTGLTEIFLPDSVTTIGDNAFWGCIDIILIVIPGNIRYIGDSAFDGCDRLIAEVSAGSNAEDLLRTAGVPYSVHSGGEATCVSAAVCARCGAQYEEKNPENHKHTELRNYVPSTCRSEGYSGDIYCFDCETLQLGKVTEKSAHVYRTEKVRPTKEAQGYTLHTCVHCDHTYKDDYIDFLYGDVNGDGKVNNLDRLLLSRWLAKWETALDEGISGDAADVNGDGKVNNLDRLVLARHLARWAGYETLG